MFNWTEEVAESKLKVCQQPPLRRQTEGGRDGSIHILRSKESDSELMVIVYLVFFTILLAGSKNENQDFGKKKVDLPNKRIKTCHII